uniref:helix-turn-helix domain-containing protein n=1 Tax=Clostridium sp. NkU-1 TaxID=1095009 RepID=UPI003260BD37
MNSGVISAITSLQRDWKKSKKLLADPARKIYEISEEMGWADVSNYIKLFKKKYGISPKEYRNIIQPEGGSAEKKQ